MKRDREGHPVMKRRQSLFGLTFAVALFFGFLLGWWGHGAFRERGKRGQTLQALQGLKSADPVQRTEAAWRLAADPDPKFTDELAPLLMDEEDHVRLAAAVALARVGIPAIPAVLRVIREESRKRDRPFHFLPGQFFRNPREAGVFILTHIARSSLGAREVAKLLGNEDPTVVRIAQEALEKVGPSAMPAILPYLRSEKRTVRLAALSVLGGYGDKAVDVLRRLLLDEKASSRWDAQTRQMAVYVLGRTKSDRALSILRELLKDTQLKRAAWQAIGNLRTEGAKAFLLGQARRYKKAKRPPPIGLIQALGASQVPQAKPFLLEWLKDEHSRVREAAATAIGMLLSVTPMEEAKPILLHLLNDREPFVAAAAARALGRFADPETLPDLLKALKRPHLVVQFAVLDALQTVGDRKALPALERFIRQKEVPKPIRQRAERVADYLRRYGR